MYLPRNLMWHLVDHSKFTESATGAAARVPTIFKKGIRCNVQPVGGTVTNLYKQREEQPSQCLYSLDGESIGNITVRDRITFNGTHFRVIGIDDLVNINAVYRVDLIQEVT